MQAFSLLEATISELRGRGVKVSDGSPVGRGHQAFLTDPAGNLIELGCQFHSSGAAGTPDANPCAEPLQRVHQAIADLLEEFQAPPLNAARRAYPRIVFNDRIEVVLSSTTEPIIGYARDLSKGGIAFITTAPVALEAASVFLPRRGGPPLRVRAQVLRCNKIKDDLYDIGARFLELT